MVGPQRQLRQRVPCQYLSAALRGRKAGEGLEPGMFRQTLHRMGLLEWSWFGHRMFFQDQKQFHWSKKITVCASLVLLTSFCWSSWSFLPSGSIVGPILGFTEICSILWVEFPLLRSFSPSTASSSSPCVENVRFDVRSKCQAKSNWDCLMSCRRRCRKLC